MTKQVQRRRGTATQHTSFTGAEGEISVNTTNKSVHVHDGTTAGGIEAARADMTNVTDADLNARLNGNTLSSLTITSADINGGTIDGTVIGSTTAAAGTFSTATVNGNIIVTGTVDGRDIAADGTKLDGIESGADVTDTTNVASALASLGYDTDLATMSVPASTTISAFGATLVDDANAATARTTLGLGTASTTSSTDYAAASHTHLIADVTDFTDNSSNWDTAYGWGNHASAGYLTGYTETDPIYISSSWYTTTNNSSNWDTAYGWGDHAAAGYTDQALALAIALG